MVSVVIKCGSGNRMKFFIGLVCYICPRVSFCLGKGPSIKHINFVTCQNLSLRSMWGSEVYPDESEMCFEVYPLSHHPPTQLLEGDEVAVNISYK